MDNGYGDIEARLCVLAETSVQAKVDALARCYDRRRDLLRLGAPAVLEKRADARVVRWLRKALRRERARALTGHWSYRAGRHIALRAALEEETRRMLEAASAPPE